MSEKETTGSKRFTLIIPNEIHGELTKEAKSRYQSLQGFIMSVLTDYLKNKGE